MSKLSKSILGGLLFTVWVMCFVFPASLFMGFADHTPIGQILVQQVVNFFVIWFFFSAIAHAVVGMFDDINRRPPNSDRDHDRVKPKDEYDIHGNGIEDKGDNGK